MTAPTPNYDEAIDFLLSWGGDRMSCILLHPDMHQGQPRALLSATFPKTSEGSARLHAWLEGAQNGLTNRKWPSIIQTYNAYFAVNDFKGDLGRTLRKPHEDQITTVYALHADLDHVDIDETVARLEADEQPPDRIIFSGGGLNCYWLLDPPAAVSSEAERMYIKSLNIGLREKWNGDGVANLDRILRVPGTLNFPNEKKRKEGRDVAVAKLVR